jgi:hypothetical protein
MSLHNISLMFFFCYSELRLDAIEEKEAVQSANKVLEEMQNNYNDALESLQENINRYKHFGLEFERADNNVLR